MAPSTPLYSLFPETFHLSLTTTGRIGMKQFVQNDYLLMSIIMNRTMPFKTAPRSKEIRNPCSPRANMNIPATPQPLFPKRMSEATVDVTLELRLWLWARRHFLEGKTPNLILIGSRIIDEKL